MQRRHRKSLESAISLHTFGDNVRKGRTELGLSQAQLAEKCGLHTTYISGIERGVRNVSALNIERIAKALKLKPHQLLVE